jgi:hypothetical protein
LRGKPIPCFSLSHCRHGFGASTFSRFLAEGGHSDSPILFRNLLDQYDHFSPFNLLTLHRWLEVSKKQQPTEADDSDENDSESDDDATTATGQNDEEELEVTSAETDKNLRPLLSLSRLHSLVTRESTPPPPAFPLLMSLSLPKDKCMLVESSKRTFS